MQDNDFWSVICVDCNDMEIYSVDLFRNYVDAKKFVHDDMEEFMNRWHDDWYIVDNEYEIIMESNQADGFCCKYVIKPVKIH